MEAWRQWLLGGEETFVSEKKPGTHYEPRIPLTPTGLLMEGHYTQNPCRGILSAMADVSPTTMIEVFPTYCEFLASVPMDRVSTLISMM